MNQRAAGLRAATASAIFLGLAPVFGKQAILQGMPPLAVVALRTSLAGLLLVAAMWAFNRKAFYIYPAGLIGCLLAGGINGLGSLLFYSALARIDASVGQLLYALYPLFVAIWMRLDRQPLSRLTLLRLSLAVPALYFLTQSGQQEVDLVGMGMMLGAAALYALHLPINQRVLYDMPAPTVTLYTLISMSIVVAPAFLINRATASAAIDYTAIPPQAWLAVGGMTVMMFLSRLTLFVGVKHLGGMQTALLGLGELLVTVVGAHLWLGERLSGLQWAGAILLAAGLGLVGMEKISPPRRSLDGWLSWLRPTHALKREP
jgi:drug/metabolite transporter (DMT)-like permease